MSRDGSLPSECSDLGDLQQLVLLIAAKDKRRGIMTFSEAMRIADEEQAELVKVDRVKLVKPGLTKRLHVYRLAEQSDRQHHIGERNRTL